MRMWLRSRSFIELSSIMAIIHFVIGLIGSLFYTEPYNWILDPLASIIYGLIMGGILRFWVRYEDEK